MNESKCTCSCCEGFVDKNITVEIPCGPGVPLSIIVAYPCNTCGLLHNNNNDPCFGMETNGDIENEEYGLMFLKEENPFTNKEVFCS